MCVVGGVVTIDLCGKNLSTNKYQKVEMFDEISSARSIGIIGRLLFVTLLSFTGLLCQESERHSKLEIPMDEQ